MKIRFEKITTIIPSSLLLLCCGCIYSDMTHLSDDDLEWMEGFRNETKFEYKSKNNSIDTVMTGYYGIFNQTSPIHFSESGSDIYIAHADVTFFLNSNKAQTQFRFYIGRHIENPDSLHIVISSEYPHDINDPNKYLQPNVKLTFGSYKHNKSFFHDYLIADISYSQPPVYPWGPKKYLKKIVIQKGKGLVYYKYTDGEEYFYNRIIDPGNKN